MQSSAARGAPVGAVIAIVGGILLAVGSFLSWAEVTGGGVSVSAKGVDGSDGYVTLVAGLLAIAVGAAGLRMGRRALGIVAIVAGLAGGGFGLYDALTAEDSVLDAAAEEIAPEFGVGVEEVRVVLDEAIDAGQLDISVSIGLYAVIAGGVLALVGGVLMLGSSSRAATTASVAPAVGAPAPPMTSPAPTAPATPAAPATPEGLVGPAAPDVEPLETEPAGSVDPGTAPPPPPAPPGPPPP